ncbi:MAG: hypothetical protein A2785_03165 [Candidatus Chisholmbacteria bacterium RIFCSPHIGHO2_01_FULL_49_18]|uniref:Nucleoside 2-deoxyribosyltransferase n=1 Tax=Candidatus Chisholmbacteria bacterium RIFCSPHIGHO2_01_FULL_49_18 TaxID=1797590 RepID=A0A1G1VME0_9BACT|nr:MAG: hypothetical protein A2785_03165 [Candidatus Chisholmbacteria bacterium RIFCSPHIGHO2_01_FULL_49_18]
MKVYFTASLRYKKRFGGIYREIVEDLEKDGHEVYSEILSEHLPEFSDVSSQKLRQWSKEWASFIRECDFVLVEGSYPSTIHIGFEVGMALAQGKPVVLLFQQGHDPIFLNTFIANKLIKTEYDERDLQDILRWSVEEVEQLSSRRFTFFISSEIDEYLSQVAKGGSLSRSEYIRGLIEREIEKKR